MPVIKHKHTEPDGMLVDENGKPTGGSVLDDIADDPETDAEWRRRCEKWVPRIIWDPNNPAKQPPDPKQ